MDIQWTEVKSNKVKYCPRWGHSSCVMKNQDLLLFGGYADKTYFNDTWIFNHNNHQWSLVEIEQNEFKPQSRSNASLFYDLNCEGILMFGGGSSGNMRFNDLWKLIILNSSVNQFKGKWTKINIESEQIPWGRTYHIGEVYQNYFIIHGGEGYGSQLDDIWVINLHTFQWKELKCEFFPKGRKFHTSAIVNDKLYIIGGSYGDYNCLNEIYSLNLITLKHIDFSKISDEKFKWSIQQPLYKESFTLARWGHISKVFDNKIYIFGGRTFMELNDLLVFDVQKNQIRKIQTCKTPVGRRKPCSFLVGSFLIINSGYNGSYLEDQFCINLHYTRQINSLSSSFIQQISHKKQNCDVHINTIDNKYVDLRTKFIQNSFQSTDDMINFMEELAQMNHLTASKYVNILNNGVFKGKNSNQQTQNLLTATVNASVQSIQPEQYVFDGQIDQNILKKYKVTYSSSSLLTNKKKILFNIIKESLITNLHPFKCIKVDYTQFDRILKHINKNHELDLQIHTLDKQQLLCQKYTLTLRSNYFKNLLKKRKNLTQKENSSNKQILKVDFQALYMKILTVYCYYGHVLIPSSLSLGNLIKLYEISCKYAFLIVSDICLEQIKDILLQKNSLQSITEQQLLLIIEAGFMNIRNCKWQYILEIILSKLIMSETLQKKKSLKNIAKFNKIDMNAIENSKQNSKKQIIKSFKDIKSQDQDKQNISVNSIKIQAKSHNSRKFDQKQQKNKSDLFSQIKQKFTKYQKFPQLLSKVQKMYRFQLKNTHKNKKSSLINLIQS